MPPLNNMISENMEIGNSSRRLGVIAEGRVNINIILSDRKLNRPVSGIRYQVNTLCADKGEIPQHA